MAQTGILSILKIANQEYTIKDEYLTNVVDQIIDAITDNNREIGERINDLDKRAFDALIKISSFNESEIASIEDGMYKLQYVTITGEGDNATETLDNSAILIQTGNNQYLYKDGLLWSRVKSNNSWDRWNVIERGVTSVNGMTGAVTIADKLSTGYEASALSNEALAPTGNDTFEIAIGKLHKAILDNEEITAQAYADIDERIDELADVASSGDYNDLINTPSIPEYISDLENDEGFINASSLKTIGGTSIVGTGNISFPVTSVNGKTGAVTINVPVTSVNGKTGAVTITHPVTSVNGMTGVVTVNVPVTSVNGMTGAVSLTAEDVKAEPDYSKQYLTFEALEDTTFTFTQNALQYSLDNGITWTTLAAGTASPTVSAGNKIMWKQTGLIPTSSDGIGIFSSTGQFNAQGNIMSLYYGDNFVGQVSLSGKEYAFNRLFNYSFDKLINASNLMLPATTLATHCYENMFCNCTSLTAAPELPATTLEYECYYRMFYGCTSLTTAPELPATTLAEGCYHQMFRGCTSLIIVPKLPTTILVDNCYDGMFMGCASLRTAPELPATTLANGCYSSMFSKCTHLTTAPELPATALVDGCYQSMFTGCTNLNYIKCLATDISATDCTKTWVKNVSSTGTFVKADNMDSWVTVTDNNGIPFGWEDDIYTESEYEVVRHYELNNVGSVTSVNGMTGAVSLNIPDAQIQSDWNQTATGAKDYIKNKPNIVTSVNGKTGAVTLDIPSEIITGQIVGRMHRDNVSGTGNLTITGASGEGFSPTGITTAGKYIVVVYSWSDTKTFGYNISFGSNNYTLTTTDGTISDKRELTVSAGALWSGSVTVAVSAGTTIIVEIYKAEKITPALSVGTVALTNLYNDLDGKPTISSSTSSTSTTDIASSRAVKLAYDNGGVQSVNGMTGAVTITIPEGQLSNNYATATGTNSELLLASGDTYEKAFGKLEKEILDNELIAAAGMNDLNEQIANITHPVTSVNGQTGAVTGLAPLVSPGFSGTPTAPTPTAGTNNTQIATTAFVQTAVSQFGNAMEFKGSVGTGGTYTSSNFPASSSSNKGWTVKIITDGTYQGVTAKEGDTLISDGTTWVLIPSGDEPNGTVMSVGLSMPTGFEVSNSPITSSGTLEVSMKNGYMIPTTTQATQWTNKVTSVNGKTGTVTINIPVTSVNGQTGAVVITHPVTSVNGQTGAVVTTLSDEYEPSSENNDDLLLESGDTYEEAFGKLEKEILNNSEITAAAIQQIASAQANAVTSVNGETGDVEIPIYEEKILTAEHNEYDPGMYSFYINGESPDNNQEVIDLLVQNKTVIIDDTFYYLLDIKEDNVNNAQIYYIGSINHNNSELNIIGLRYLLSSNSFYYSQYKTINLGGGGVTSVNGQTGIVTISDKLSTGYSASVLTNDALNPTGNDTFEIAIGKLHKSIIDNEEVTSGALADLDERIDNLATVATSGNYNDLINKPIITHPVTSVNGMTGAITLSQINADWNSATGASQILNKPAIKTNNSTSYISYNYNDDSFSTTCINIDSAYITAKTSTNNELRLGNAEFYLYFNNGTSYLKSSPAELIFNSNIDTSYMKFTSGGAGGFNIYSAYNGYNLSIYNNWTNYDNGSAPRLIASSYNTTNNTQNVETFAFISDITSYALVTSVNGQTGTVTVNVPVTSVNGMTGAISQTQADWIDNDTTSYGFIKNKPQITTAKSGVGVYSTYINKSSGAYYTYIQGTTSYLYTSAIYFGTGISYLSNNSYIGNTKSNSTKVATIGDIPVTSVNGQTGAVTITHPVTFVNGMTGVVLLTAEDVKAVPDYSKQYLTFEALQDTTFKFTINALQYSLDNGATWTTLSKNTASPMVTAGNKIMWKQTGLTPALAGGIGQFSSTGNFNVQGNIMSLYYGDDFINQTDLTGKSYAFKTLFSGNSHIIEAKNLILPALQLTPSCYDSMFQSCINLITIPKLPATTLANSCYHSMFYGCTSLTTAPSLPATVLGQYCYFQMFGGCTSLTTAPELPSTTLANSCYEDMFYGCTSLTIAPELPATTLANSCYRDMFSNCTSLITAPSILPATTVTDNCCYYMFMNCTSLTIAPELPATILAYQCYSYMFEGCISLTTAPELPSTTLAPYCYDSMFNGCTNLNYIKCLAINITTPSEYYEEMTDYCTGGWVSNVSATGIFIKNSLMTSWPIDDNGIPTGWTAYTESEYEVVRHYELSNLSSGVTSVNGMTGAVSGLAPILSPGFTGIPTAPTPATGTNTTQIATTAFVQTELSNQHVIFDLGSTSDSTLWQAESEDSEKIYIGTITPQEITAAINAGKQVWLLINNMKVPYIGQTGFGYTFGQTIEGDTTLAFTIPDNGIFTITNTLQISLSMPTGFRTIQGTAGSGGTLMVGMETGYMIPTTVQADLWTNKVSNVQSDWNATTGAAVILNKPTIPAAVTESTVSGWGFTKNQGQVISFNGSTGNVSQVKANWNETDSSSYAYIQNKPTIPAAVTESTVSGWGFTKNAGQVTTFNGNTGNVSQVKANWNETDSTSYAYIQNKPTIPTVNNSTVTITMNGNTVGTFTLNKSGNTTIDLGNVLTSHQSIKTINNQTITGTGNVALNTLPTVSSSDNGKVLMVVDGAWQLVSPVSLYSGSSAPSNSQGNNGDIYVQS